MGAVLIGGLALALTFAPAPLSVRADDHRGGHYDDDDEHDHDRALEAVQRGEVLPLEKVLAAVRTSVEGSIVRTKLKQKNGVWVYELKSIGRDGRMRKIRVDAKTAALLPDEHKDDD